jgi:hypothetical protein
MRFDETDPSYNDATRAEHRLAKYELMKLVCHDVVVYIVDSENNAYKDNDSDEDDGEDAIHNVSTQQIDAVRSIFMMLYRSGFDFNVKIQKGEDHPIGQQQILCFTTVKCLPIALILLDIATLQQHSAATTSTNSQQNSTNNFVQNAWCYLENSPNHEMHIFREVLDKCQEVDNSKNEKYHLMRVDVVVKMIPLLQDSILFERDKVNDQSAFWQTFSSWCELARRTYKVMYRSFHRIMKEFLKIVAQRADAPLRKRLRNMLASCKLRGLEKVFKKEFNTITKTLTHASNIMRRNRKTVKHLVDTIFPNVLTRIIQQYA